MSTRRSIVRLEDSFPEAPAYVVVYPARREDYDSQSSDTIAVTAVVFYSLTEMQTAIDRDADHLSKATIYELEPMKLTFKNTQVTKTVKVADLVRK